MLLKHGPLYPPLCLIPFDPLGLHLTLDVFQGTLDHARKDGRHGTRRRLFKRAARLVDLLSLYSLGRQLVCKRFCTIFTESSPGRFAAVLRKQAR